MHYGQMHIVYYTLVDCNPLTPLLQFVLDLLYNLFLQLCSSWQDYNWHRSLRGPSVVAELLVCYEFDDNKLCALMLLLLMCCRKVVDLWSMQRTQYSCWESVWQVTVIRRNLMLHNKNFQHVIVRTLLTLHLLCKNIHRYTFAYLHAIRVNVPYLDIAKIFYGSAHFMFLVLLVDMA